MIKIDHKWYYYWLGCALGGILLGITIVYFFPEPTDLTSLALPQESPALSLPIASPQPQNVTVLFTGDVMLGRSVGYNIAVSQDPKWPFASVASVMQEADITYINLENPLTVGCPLTQTGMTFCSETTNVAGLVDAGVDIASLANNHTTNYGPGGLATTITMLSSNGISPVGVGAPVRLTRHGQVFTFLSFNDIGPYPGIDNVDPASLAGKIRQTKVDGEVLIVTFHWGHEYNATSSQRQTALAHQAIDAGADLIVGSHPHWVQTKEIYQGKPIYYSLGNFVFDQEWSRETKRGLVVRFTYQGTNLVDTQELPILIENYGQPRFQ